MGFHETQLAAMYHNTGPALILAGPGSGKTTVITHRIRYLIEHYCVAPSDILVITFTKMAANEMKERFLKLSDGQYGAVSFGTFHAIYFTILKHAYHYKGDNIIRQDQQLAFIQEQLAKYQLEIQDVNEFSADLLSEIGRIKNERANLTEYISSNCPENVFRDLYRNYESMLRNRRLIDFDDMLIYCYELLANRKDILLAWQEKYKYILIDEFQDINRVQFDVINLVAEKYKNIFVVGDDDQSIYGFRGAKPEIMQEFKQFYPDAIQINLEVNYRSTANIVNAAKSVIDQNKNRFYKELVTINEKGSRVLVKECKGIEEENTFVLETIEAIKKRTGVYKNTVVLTRTNAGAERLIQNFISHEIPYRSADVVKNMYQHWIAQDLLAYIRIACGNAERKLFLRIMNKPLRYISRESMVTPMVDLEQLKFYYKEKDWMVKRIEQLRADLDMIRDLSPFAAVNYIRKGIGYDDYLKEHAKEHRVSFENLMEILEDIHHSTKKSENFEQWFTFIDTYTEQLTEQNLNRQTCDDAVSICTLHSSKGLEYENVLILDVNEGIMPYNKSVLAEEIEEERRMFYVGMTRAKQSLILCFTNERYNKKVYASRFLDELDKTYVKQELICNEKQN